MVRSIWVETTAALDRKQLHAEILSKDHIKWILQFEIWGALLPTVFSLLNRMHAQPSRILKTKYLSILFNADLFICISMFGAPPR